MTLWHYFCNIDRYEWAQSCVESFALPIYTSPVCLLTGNNGTNLVCRCPDDTPRKLLQYGYCPSWPGFLIIHCWTAVLVVSYLLVIWGCLMSYVIASDLYFPPSQQFWLETFKSWDGIMFPWCVLFVLSHLCLVGVLIFWDAMRSHSMLPADSMGSASHLMVQEMNEADAPRAFGVVGLCFALSRYLRRLRARQILPIQKSEGGTRFVEHMCVRVLTLCRFWDLSSMRPLSKWSNQNNNLLRAGSGWPCEGLITIFHWSHSVTSVIEVFFTQCLEDEDTKTSKWC